ncbi:MAG: proteasome assembly chaperone family protein [Candidatus Methanomethylophilaceae archaeon]
MVEALYIHEYEKMKFKNALAIVGFPSLGLVSSIATNFIVRTMDLKRIAGISSPDFPPYSLVQGGFPMPPVRIYAGDRICDDDGEDCEHLIVITAEFMPKMEMHYPIAKMILDWCEENDIKTILTMEGIAVPDVDGTPIYGVGSTDAMREKVGKYGIKPMEEGMVRGLSGIILYEAAAKGTDVMTLLGPARADIPDARGAARLLEPIKRMLPELKLDIEPLLKEAEEIETKMKEAAQGITPPTGNEPIDNSYLYG